MCACTNRNGSGESRAQRPNARRRRIGNAGRAVAAIRPLGPLRERTLGRTPHRGNSRERRAARPPGLEKNSGNPWNRSERRGREAGWVGSILFSVRASANRHAGSLLISSTRARETGLTKVKNFSHGEADRMTFLTDSLRLGELPMGFRVLELQKKLP